MAAQSVYFTGPREVDVRETAVPDPGPNELEVTATVSAISSGTELLLYRGEMDPEIAADETLEALSGSFSYPFPYGYAVVGTVTAVGADVDPAWRGETVLAFHPHASEFVVGVDEVSIVPADVSPAAAAFLPNVETAVNLVLDGGPRIGERAVVFGQGVVGLLTTALLAETPLSSLVTVDCYEERRQLSTAFGADRSLDPDGPDPIAALHERTTAPDRPGSPSGRSERGQSPRRADLTYELSGNPAALDAAVDATGYGGRVVVGSWYGTKTAELSLDGRFHRSRIRLISSQVSTIAPERRGRWTVARRLATAWRRLEGLETDRLVTHRVPIADAPKAYELLDERPDETVQVLLTY
ncbi:zinc-binding alcohol dehydrogenase [Natrinema sp. J7-2]|uniref:zinc-dependent alcohol dehydrogenase n=1 Tax=Natrinema sp. (strain J7-2) TaxID=406552 RepID=UPI00026D4E41|nr:zinc-binding alcohol dehydrogenase [Natrinema sp. J7-2]AFO55886.1 Alcohol dehydrogenase zinc-binding domain protein [Natrinema sp. J7-2]